MSSRLIIGEPKTGPERNPELRDRQFAFVAGFSLLAFLAILGLGLAGQQQRRPAGLSGIGPEVHGTPDDPLRDLREVHLRHVKQLTFGGQNAEAYFSPDGKRLVFQSTRGPFQCDQIFVMDLNGRGVHSVSTGIGRTTCGYFYPDGKHLLYSSTHLSSPDCPSRPDYSKGYVWGVYSSYQIFKTTDSGEIVKQITRGPGYNAEATFSADGKKIVFTSSRDGDLDIYVMDPEGNGARRLTTELGYDGGPFFSPDGEWIVYRARHPTATEEVSRYKSLLSQDLVEPSKMDLWLMRADGSARHPITHLDGASFAPSFLPDSRRIIFASNHQHPESSQFELYAIDRTGDRLERITFAGGFNAFPVFSPDGKKLVFASNRNGKKAHEINVFIADWVR